MWCTIYLHLNVSHVNICMSAYICIFLNGLFFSFWLSIGTKLDTKYIHVWFLVLNTLYYRICKKKVSSFVILGFTRRYSLLCGLSSSSCGGLWPSVKSFFCPLGQKRAFYAVLAFFCCSVLTSVTFSNNHSNFDKNKKKFHK